MYHDSQVTNDSYFYKAKTKKQKQWLLLSYIFRFSFFIFHVYLSLLNLAIHDLDLENCTYDSNKYGLDQRTKIVKFWKLNCTSDYFIIMLKVETYNSFYLIVFE